MELVKEVYRVDAQFPQSEQFGLRSQLCRAAVSIPSNIAEGHRRKTKKDFVQFLHIAAGSAAETETQILITESVFPEINLGRSKLLIEEIQKMLSAMIARLKTY